MYFLRNKVGSVDDFNDSLSVKALAEGLGLAQFTTQKLVDNYYLHVQKTTDILEALEYSKHPQDFHLISSLALFKEHAPLLLIKSDTRVVHDYCRLNGFVEYRGSRTITFPSGKHLRFS